MWSRRGHRNGARRPPVAGHGRDATGEAGRSIAQIDSDRAMTAGTRAVDILRRAGIEHRVHTYARARAPRPRSRIARPSYGLEAAAALGVAPDRLCKTLAAVVDDRMVLAVVPVDRELDLKALAEACAGRKAVMAESAAAERATGYVVGGISPLGVRRPLPVVVDASALAHRDCVRLGGPARRPGRTCAGRPRQLRGRDCCTDLPVGRCLVIPVGM